MPLSGLLSAYGFAGGWPSIFYVFGLVGTLWCIMFLLFVSEDPEQCPRIKEAEKKYILSSLWGAAGSSVSDLLITCHVRRNEHDFPFVLIIFFAVSRFFPGYFRFILIFIVNTLKDSCIEIINYNLHHLYKPNFIFLQ